MNKSLTDNLKENPLLVKMYLPLQKQLQNHFKIMKNLIVEFFTELLTITNEMSPYLLLGFLIAGFLQVLFPEQSANKIFGTNKLYSSVKAALIGVPLPLCSCGVIPTGVALHKNGASKGSTLSFLISTPQTGVDSILATYSLLGLPFAIIRPIVAFITGVFGGYFANHLDSNPHSKTAPPKAKQQNTDTLSQSIWQTTQNILHYGFIVFLESIAKWLLIGILLATFVSLLVPDHFFETTHFSPIVQALIVLTASIPLYICATGSIPLAAVLMLKGLSPGAALVLLMAGPATNIATITVILKTLGKKSLFIYLSTIIGGAMLGALFIDYILPSSWFELTQLHPTTGHQHGLTFFWKISSSIILISLLFFVLLKPYFKKYINQKKDTMNQDICKVEGINCNHCKSSIERDLSELPFIKTVEVNVQSGEVLLEGDDIDFKTVEEHINNLGFKYKGKQH